jgi:hypothetical protein
MPAELGKYIGENLQETETVGVGKMVEVETQGGTLQIIGTQKGFVTRKPGDVGVADDVYEGKKSLTIELGENRTVITPKANSDYTESGMLDPMV